MAHELTSTYLSITLKNMQNVCACNKSVGLPKWHYGKGSSCQCRRCKRCKRCEFKPRVGNIPWRRKWQSTPVFLPGKFHGQMSLAGYSPWGLIKVIQDEQLSMNKQYVCYSREKANKRFKIKGNCT